jgi:signal transduction histidine kinase
VEGAVQDGSTLVNRYRAIARSGFTATADRVDLNASVATVVDYARQYAAICLKAEGPQVDVRFNPAPEELAVLGDGGELREALLNLVRNAIEAIPERGTVRVLTSREDGAAVVDILDDGTGMTPEVQRQIFTPMFTTKGELGTGLGLASAHSTISRHQGAIEVESWPGKGTRIRLTLPLAPASP